MEYPAALLFSVCIRDANGVTQAFETIKALHYNNNDTNEERLKCNFIEVVNETGRIIALESSLSVELNVFVSEVFDEIAEQYELNIKCCVGTTMNKLDLS